MTRRTTSVIQPTRAHSPASLALNTPQVFDWQLAAVRELLLSPSGDDDQEQRNWQRTRRLWRIVYGTERGNPAAPDGSQDRRSDVFKVVPKPGHTGPAYWDKRYFGNFTEQQANETNVLKYLSERPASEHENVREHVAYAMNFGQARDDSGTAKGSRLAVIHTLDGGPGLDLWEQFGLCCKTADGLVLPFFTHPDALAAVVWRNMSWQ